MESKRYYKPFDYFLILEFPLFVLQPFIFSCVEYSTRQQFFVLQSRSVHDEECLRPEFVTDPFTLNAWKLELK